MQSDVKKQMANIARLLIKVAIGEPLNGNEFEALQNIVDELEFGEVEESDFRY